MKRVLCAEYKQYNANNRGISTTDCVKRALSMAFNLDYIVVSKELNTIKKELNSSAYNVPKVYEKFIYNHGGGRELQVSDTTLTLNDTIDSIANSGVYIFETSHKPSKFKYGDHLVCVIDGQIFDSWDSREEYVCGYWKISNSSNFQFGDISDHWDELIHIAESTIESECEKCIKKWNIPGCQFDVGKGFLSGGYTIQVILKVNTDDGDSSHNYIFKISSVCSPSMSYSQAKKKIIDTVKVRVYDRFYSIRNAILEEQEARQLFKDSGYNNNTVVFDTEYLNPREFKFYNSLPGWVKPFVTYVYVQSPGQYNDSYQLRFRPIKGDKDRDVVCLHGYDSGMIKEELQMYRESYVRPDIDYSVYDL